MRVIERTVAPVASPVSLAECKRDLRMTTSNQDQDQYIQELIKEAVDYIDGPFGALGVAMITQRWKWTVDRLCDLYRLPINPAQSVFAIRYYDGDNVQQTFDTENYTLIKDRDAARLELGSGISRPTTYDRIDAVEIEFVVGFGDKGSDVPASIRRAIRLLVAHWFENPTPNMVGTMTTPVQHTFDTLIAAHRGGWFG